MLVTISAYRIDRSQSCGEVAGSIAITVIGHPVISNISPPRLILSCLLFHRLIEPLTKYVYISVSYRELGHGIVVEDEPIGSERVVMVVWKEAPQILQVR